MSAPGAGGRGGVLHRWLTQRVRVACVVSVVIFLWAVGEFYSPVTGFTSLISIGDVLRDREVSALRGVPHYVYEESAGYDGAYYVQLALSPALNNPELAKAIDNLPYRARRILFCWTAWALGLGQPEWVVQAHALLNVLAWLALAGVLLRWFPPANWENFLRWFGVMFSSGVCMSVRNSLVDAPSLLLVALAVAWLERGRRAPGVALLALAGLGKETSLLAVTGFATGKWRVPRTWLRLAGTAALVVLPLLAWIGYVRWKVGPADDTGFGNFTVPLSGLAEKWGDSLGDLLSHPYSPTAITTLATVVALTAQFAFFLLRWRPGEPWWRIGATYALLLVFLATPVWEGFPGAATRVLLPMMLAFNITVPRGRRWLPLLLAGNLTVLAAYKEFTPPHEFFHLHGERRVLLALRVERTGGWHGVEFGRGAEWRWSNGEAGLRFHNDTGGPLALTFHGQVASAHDERRVRVFKGEVLLWGEAISSAPEELRFGLVLPPGETELEFKSDAPGHPVGTDERRLAFRVTNLEIVVKPAPAHR